MPEGWQTFTGEELTTKITKGSSPKWQGFEYQSEGVLFVTSENVRDGFLDVSEPKFLPLEFSQKARNSRLKFGDILVNIVGASIGRACRFNLKAVEANVNQAVCVLRLKPEFEADFFLYLLQAPHVQRRLLGERSDSARPNLSLADFRRFSFDCPPFSQQRKIAEILRTWDEAIEKLEALRAAKDQQRKGVSQDLFAIDRPFPSHWERKPLEEISERIRRTNDGGDHPVMTISAKSGFLMQSDKFARDMAGSSVDRYTLLQEGEFAYNKGNSKTAPYGCVFQLDHPSAVIPFVYFCFKLNAGLHHPFYRHLFAAGALNHQLSRLINSGVRNDGLLNLYADDFFKCQVPVPPLAEQQEIAAIITAANKEIELLDKQIEAVTRQKRGLMQKLLTGEWRVVATDKSSKEATE